MPLRHLIVLIVDAHPSAEARVRNCSRPAASTSSLKRPASHCRQWCGQHPMIASKGVATFPTTRPCCHGTVDQCPIHDVIQPCMVRRKPACMDHAKQIIRGQDAQDPDGSSANHPAIIFLNTRKMVEPDGIEPTTSCLQSTRSPN